jgi:hypothetical protein
MENTKGKLKEVIDRRRQCCDGVALAKKPPTLSLGGEEELGIGEL